MRGQNLGKEHFPALETMDSCQGSEMFMNISDLAVQDIASNATRHSADIGFVSDLRRVNVDKTRAQHVR